MSDEKRTGDGLNEPGPLAARIAKGRAKYANGCTVLSLIDASTLASRGSRRRRLPEPSRDTAPR